MLNILNKLSAVKDIALYPKNFSVNPKSIRVNPYDTKTSEFIFDKPESIYNVKEYNNMIYRPSSNKEWHSTVYSFNKSYLKPLVVYDRNLNKLLPAYCNMEYDKKKNLFKTRRHNKSRYSANKIYASKAELKHSNAKVLILLYVYNKKKSFLEKYLRNLILLTKFYPLKTEYKTKFLVKDKDKNLTIVKSDTEIMHKTMNIPTKNDNRSVKYLSVYINRLNPLTKDRYFAFRKWNRVYFTLKNNLFNYLRLKSQNKLYNNIVTHYMTIRSRNLIKFQNQVFFYTKLINFNVSKFNNLRLKLRNLGLISLIQKIYDKKIEIKLVELKSLHLNSDVFTSAVALKLRNRHNKAVGVLRQAILQMVKIPDLHTLITFDNNVEMMNKNNVVSTIKQQAVTGVRFEASGRLTRRLTAMRAVFKYRYTGGLKNIRSSYAREASAMLRGYAKSNSQYTIINSKTRNGTFGLKGWVSSH